MGPKISSCAIRLEVSTPVKRAGRANQPPVGHRVLVHGVEEGTVLAAVAAR